jgi:gas vesicle protein
MNKDSGAGFFTGLIVGAIIGLSVGYLYAPQPGTETRRILKEKMGTVKEKAKETASRAASRIKERVSQRMEAQDEE